MSPSLLVVSITAPPCTTSLPHKPDQTPPYHSHPTALPQLCQGYLTLIHRIPPRPGWLASAAFPRLCSIDSSLVFLLPSCSMAYYMDPQPSILPGNQVNNLLWRLGQVTITFTCGPPLLGSVHPGHVHVRAFEKHPVHNRGCFKNPWQETFPKLPGRNEKAWKLW